MMATIVHTEKDKRSNDLWNIFDRAKHRFPVLHYTALVHVGLFLLSLLAMVLDTRELAGLNVWIKPAKFLVSTFIFLWTVTWYLEQYSFPEKMKTWIANAFTALLSIENIIISIQAGRGVISHYNESSAFDGLMFGLMGIAVGLITLLVAILFLLSFFSRLQVNSSMQWGIRIAWFAFLFSSMVGGMMIRQRGHNVGVMDGGAGIPFLNWSTEGGDLRVAHFFGLHAIQVIPLTIYFLSLKIKRSGLRQVLSILFALSYLAWVVFNCYQAQAGQAFITS